jgi:GntR family transcriptional repressor for pyruvate dehydrogenase complex
MKRNAEIGLATKSSEMAAMNVSPIQKASATAKVFKALYEMIAAGRYRRGQRLPPQEELARQFGVSRNTLREAINQLSAMGLLSSRQGVGTVVEPPSPDGYLRLSGQPLTR